MNKELIIRLSKYKRLLHKFKALGLERVFSNNLGDAIGVTPALVRKDFSMLELPGNKRGGYNIDEILERLNRQLGLDKEKTVIVVGCGKIGTALLEYRGFINEGINVVAGFDIAPKKVDTERDIPVYEMESLPRFVKQNDIQVGIIAVPDTAASEVLEQMVDAGIRGILNFAPVDLKCPKKCPNDDCPAKCIVHNINIGPEIENLFYILHINERNELPEEPECEDCSEKDKVKPQVKPPPG